MKPTRRTALSAAHYQLIGDIIRRVEDPALRQQMADHFATEFNRRSKSFDPYQWGRVTGGKVAAGSAK